MASDSNDKMLQNYRGRRYLACSAIDTVVRVIDNLGVEDGSTLPPPDNDFKPAPSDAVRLEIHNAAVNLLRLILAVNDGRVSRQMLRRH